MIYRSLIPIAFIRKGNLTKILWLLRFLSIHLFYIIHYTSVFTFLITVLYTKIFWARYLRGVSVSDKYFQDMFWLRVKRYREFSANVQLPPNQLPVTSSFLFSCNLQVIVCSFFYKYTKHVPAGCWIPPTLAACLPTLPLWRVKHECSKRKIKVLLEQCISMCTHVCMYVCRYVGM